MRVISALITLMTLITRIILTTLITWLGEEHEGDRTAELGRLDKELIERELSLASLASLVSLV